MRIRHGGVSARTRSALILVLALLAVGCAPARLLAVEDGPVRLTILHTNDMHGRLLPQLEGRAKVPTGGIARIAGMASRIRKEAEKEGRAVLLLDGGDIYAGTPEGNTTKGRLCIELMNAAGYDALCVGNHEFDDGADNLASLSASATFPFLAANITEKDTRAPPAYVKPYVLVEAGGVKVAILGVVASDTHILTGGAGGLQFRREEAALKDAARRARAEGAKLCIAMTHSGFDRDKEISDAVSELPLILGGHSHTPLGSGWKNGRTGVWVVQAGCYAKLLGRVDLRFSPATGAVLSVEASLIPLSGDGAPEDGKIASLLEKGSEDIRRIMDEPIGENAQELPRGGRRYSGVSTPLGNLLADLMREGGSADLGFHNRTGIREILPEGSVTLRHIYKICPFGNTIFVMDLTGAEVLEILEYSLKEGNRFLLEISGAVVTYDPSKEPGRRIASVTLDGKPIDPGATYRVATSNFIADGGDGHAVFKKGRNRKDTGTLLRDLFARRVRAESPLKVEYVTRLVKMR